MCPIHLYALGIFAFRFSHIYCNESLNSPELVLIPWLIKKSFDTSMNIVQKTILWLTSIRLDHQWTTVDLSGETNHFYTKPYQFRCVQLAIYRRRFSQIAFPFLD